MLQSVCTQAGPSPWVAFTYHVHLCIYTLNLCSNRNFWHLFVHFRTNLDQTLMQKSQSPGGLRNRMCWAKTFVSILLLVTELCAIIELYNYAARNVRRGLDVRTVDSWQICKTITITCSFDLYFVLCVSTGFRRLGLLKGLAVLSGRSAYSTCITFSPVQARLCEKPMDTRFGCVFCSLLTYRHVPHLQWSGFINIKTRMSM